MKGLRGVLGELAQGGSPCFYFDLKLVHYTVGFVSPRAFQIRAQTWQMSGTHFGTSPPPHMPSRTERTRTDTYEYPTLPKRPPPSTGTGAHATATMAHTAPCRLARATPTKAPCCMTFNALISTLVLLGTAVRWLWAGANCAVQQVAQLRGPGHALNCYRVVVRCCSWVLEHAQQGRSQF